MAYSLYLYHDLDPLSSISAVLYHQAYRAIGISLIDTPVVTTGMNAVSRDDAGYASWLINLSQRVGGVLTISILSTHLHRETTIHKERLGASTLAQGAPARGIIHRGMEMGFSSRQARSAARAAFGNAIGKAARSLAFQNLYYLMGLTALTAVVPAFFLSGSRAREKRSGE